MIVKNKTLVNYQQIKQLQLIQENKYILQQQIVKKIFKHLIILRKQQNVEKFIIKGNQITMP